MILGDEHVERAVCQCDGACRERDSAAPGDSDCLRPGASLERSGRPKHICLPRVRDERSVRRHQRHRYGFADGGCDGDGRKASTWHQSESRWPVLVRRAQRITKRATRVDESKLPPPDRSADGIGEVDTATNRLTPVIPAGNDPEQLDVSADGTRLFVANEDAAQASVVDLKAGKSSPRPRLARSRKA